MRVHRNITVIDCKGCSRDVVSNFITNIEAGDTLNEV